MSVSWRDFPQRYSDYGAHGIVLMTMLQSWAQGVRCWGHDGMSELRSLPRGQAVVFAAGMPPVLIRTDPSP